jgi:hypothetical protein
MTKSKLYKSILPLLLLTITCNCIQAQRIDSLLEIMETKYPQEKNSFALRQDLL